MMVLRAWLDQPSGQLRVRIIDRPAASAGGSEVVVGSRTEVCRLVKSWLTSVEEPPGDDQP